MRRIATWTMGALLALSVAGCGKAAETQQPADADQQAAETAEATTQEGEYTYEGIEAWDTPIEDWGGVTLREMSASMAKPGTDMDALIHSELGEFILSNQEVMSAGPIDGQGLVDFWAERGMVHEAHDVDDEARQWTSLVPADAKEGEPMPLLFVWHGNQNPIPMAESYGFGERAAELGWAVVYPWADNDNIYLEEFDRILAYMQDNYDIDSSRIYTAGFSKGGRVSARLALERGDVLAASAPCGISAAGTISNPDNTELLDEEGPLHLTAEDFQAAKTVIPVQFYGGSLDVFGTMPYDADFEIDGVNGWLGLIGNEKTQSLEASEKLLADSEDATERAIGLSFDETETIEEDGTAYHVGSYLDGNGNATLRFVECDGAIHMSTPYMSQIAVDFLAQYSK